MIRHVVRTFILMLMLVMILSFQVSMAHSAKAHSLDPSDLSPNAGCTGSGCTGEDPFLDGCNLSQQVLSNKGIYDRNGNYIGGVYLFYSGPCNARWADTQATDGGARVSAMINGAKGDKFSAIGVGYTYTLMVGAQAAYACGTVKWI